jgi:hypothetical protein
MPGGYADEIFVATHDGHIADIRNDRVRGKVVIAWTDDAIGHVGRHDAVDALSAEFRGAARAALAPAADTVKPVAPSARSSRVMRGSSTGSAMMVTSFSGTVCMRDLGHASDWAIRW